MTDSIQECGEGTAFPAVDPEEMAFAMSLFMGVASGQIASNLRDQSEATASCECGRVLRELVPAAMGDEAGRGRTAVGMETTLEEAFAAVWHHYGADGRRLAICARVLGFYFLAQKNGGRILGEWVRDSPDMPENVVLHPALVEAVAMVPLLENGGLPEGLFFEAVEMLAGDFVD